MEAKLLYCAIPFNDEKGNFGGVFSLLCPVCGRKPPAVIKLKTCVSSGLFSPEDGYKFVAGSQGVSCRRR